MKFKSTLLFSFVLIAIILGFFLFYISLIGMKESLTPNLTETQCTQFKTCQDCVATPDSHYGYPCYWNQRKGDCGSFLDQGYSRTCPTTKESFYLGRGQVLQSWGGRSRQATTPDREYLRVTDE